MKILKMPEVERKIGLSIRAVKYDEFQKDLHSYRETTTRSERSTLGDAFRAAQAAAKAKKQQDEEEEYLSR